jgi:hypothetical protein
MSKETDTLTKAVLTAVQVKYPHAIVWRNNTGAGVGWSFVNDAITLLRMGNIQEAIRLLRRPVFWGMVGSADILMCHGPRGRLGGIEIKAGKDRQSLEQEAWCLRIRDLGGFYIIARDVDGCLQELKEIL